MFEDDLTLVTNNAADFRKLLGAEELDPGLVIIRPNVSPKRQRELFAKVLDWLGAHGHSDLLDTAVEVEEDGGIESYELYHDDSTPVFLLDVFEKNEKTNLSKSEKNELKGLGDLLVKTYRKNR